MQEEFDDTPTVKPKQIGELFKSLPVKETKHEHQFQEVCSDLEPYYGKAIWSLPHRKGFTEYKIRKAHEIAQSRGITTLAYLIGIIRKLPY